MASAQHSLLIENQHEDDDDHDHEDNIDDSDDDNQDDLGLTGELRVKVASVSVGDNLNIELILFDEMDDVNSYLMGVHIIIIIITVVIIIIVLKMMMTLIQTCGLKGGVTLFLSRSDQLIELKKGCVFTALQVKINMKVKVEMTKR